MSPDQIAAVATAKRLAERLKRRPLGTELWKHGISLGTGNGFRTLQALLTAAGLMLPAPEGRAGLFPHEEQALLKLWESGASQRKIAVTLGLAPQLVAAEVTARNLSRACLGPRNERATAATVRRCQDCHQLNQGLGPCTHCGSPGLNAA